MRDCSRGETFLTLSGMGLALGSGAFTCGVCFTGAGACGTTDVESFASGFSGAGVISVSAMC